MYRTQFILTMLVLYVGVVQSFSWDIVISRGNRLEFYDGGTVTYSVAPTANQIHWITYDSLYNRVLFTETVSSGSVFSFDIPTRETNNLINLKPYLWHLVYDPARELLVADIIQMGKRFIMSYLVKPGSDGTAKENHVVSMPDHIQQLAVDSCKGYIYWTKNRNCSIERVRLDGSDREDLKDSCTNSTKTALTIDAQEEKIYWLENQNGVTEFFSADLNGDNKKSLYHEDINVPNQISVTKEFIYWVETPFFWRLPKHISRDTDVKPTRFSLDKKPTESLSTAIASNYVIEGQSPGNPNCEALKSSSINNLATKDNGSRNLGLIRDELKISGDSGVGGDTSNISVCHNYCIHGYCSTTVTGQPKCSCKPGYSGQRCEVNLCLGYCLHDGVCSLNGKSQPVCLCPERYEGDRCDSSIFLSKFFQYFVNMTYTEVEHWLLSSLK